MGVGIVAASLLIGMGIALFTREFTWPYLAIFLVASLVAALFTAPRGLWLTVCSIPPLFAILTGLSAWIISQQSTLSNSPFSRTTLLTSVYPVIQHFPIMVIASVAAMIIAFLRLWLLHRNLATDARSRESQRRHASESNRRNVDTAVRARQRTRTSTESDAVTGTSNGSGDQPAASSRTAASRLEAEPTPGSSRRVAQPRSRHQPAPSSRAARQRAAKIEQRRREALERSRRRQQANERAQRASSGERPVTVEELMRRSQARPQRGDRFTRDLYE